MRVVSATSRTDAWGLPNPRIACNSCTVTASAHAATDERAEAATAAADCARDCSGNGGAAAAEVAAAAAAAAAVVCSGDNPAPPPDPGEMPAPAFAAGVSGLPPASVVFRVTMPAACLSPGSATWKGLDNCGSRGGVLGGASLSNMLSEVSCGVPAVAAAVAAATAAVDPEGARSPEQPPGEPMATETPPEPPQLATGPVIEPPPQPRSAKARAWLVESFLLVVGAQAWSERLVLPMSWLVDIEGRPLPILLHPTSSPMGQIAPGCSPMLKPPAADGEDVVLPPPPPPKPLGVPVASIAIRALRGEDTDVVSEGAGVVGPWLPPPLGAANASAPSRLQK